MCGRSWCSAASVTAVDAKTFGVKSSDGFILTWTLGDKLKVVQDKKKVEASAVKVGADGRRGRGQGRRRDHRPAGRARLR